MFHLLLAADPSVPNDVGGKYVAGAYVVFIVLLLVYVAIMAMKLARIEKGLGEVAEIAEARRGEGGTPAEAAEATEAPSDHPHRHPGPRRHRPGGAGDPALSELLALGVSHKTAPLELRERLSLTEGRSVAALRELTETGDDRRGRGDLDLQPDRALPGRLRPGPGRVRGARRAHPQGRHPADRAARPPLQPARRATPPATCCGSPPGSTR